MASEHHIKTHQERTFCSGVLSVTTTFKLLVTGDTDLKHLDRIIRLLTVQKQILEEDDAEASHAPETASGQDENSEPREVQSEPLAEGRADREQ